MFWKTKLERIDPVAVDIIQSLESDPASWETNNFRLWHTSGVEVWVANEDYGIEINGHKPSRLSRQAIQQAYAKWLGSRVRVTK
jgi:hypothetical protein